ncbi:MAG: TAXI family TRAP transporter solute-binding subunit [Selenomonadaceae bacterium]|nr:TAXI family TRAP transporter solute-binding subunit [Selenomonadaceae bacterium]
MEWGKFGKLAALGVAMTFSAVALTGCGGGDNKGAEKKVEKKFINIATGGTAGTYYPLGGAMAEILNKAIPGMNASAQSTGATVANINMLKDGSVDMAIVQNDITYYAANGTEMFKDKKVSNLKAIAALYPETVQMVTLEKSGIKSVAELKGKRVAVGAAGSGTEANARQILEAAGITYNDITVQYLSFGEAANALKDGNVDVGFVTAGFPTSAIQDIASQHKVRVLSLSKDMIASLTKKYPFYTQITVPKGTYAGFDEDATTVAVQAMLVCNDKVKDDLAYSITKSIFTNLDKLKAAHSVGKLINKEAAQKGLPIAISAGAEKFYKEK